MSNEMTPSKGGSIATNAADGNPLVGLPEDCVEPIGYLWQFYAYLIPSPHALSIQVKTWVKKWELTSAEIKLAMRDLCSPETAAKLRFPADLMAEFAGKIASIVKQRANVDGQDDRREESKKWEAEAVDGPYIVHPKYRPMLAHVLGGSLFKIGDQK